MKKRALISVSDKTGIIEFSKELVKFGYEIISTGGTLNALQSAGIECIGISDITGFPECLDGRVKTLHPNVHGGLLAMRSNPEHIKQIEELGIKTIDLVVVNLYPFKITIEREDVHLAEAIENIDIGGPTMLRSAAKNYQDVTVIVDPADYHTVLNEIRENGTATLETKFNLMYKVFQHTAVYDTLIANYLREQLNIKFADQVTFAYEKVQDLRYGENPHQSAAFYKEVFKYEGSLADAVQIHGKDLSFNNINDANGALDVLREFNTPTAVAVKHSNPCGVCSADNIYDAYLGTYNADPVSIFGGIVALNREVDDKTALELNKIFLEIVIAPSFTEEAMQILTKKANLRILKLASINAPLKHNTLDFKKVVGGLLIQDIDNSTFNDSDVKVVTKLQPTEEQMNDLKFAFRVVKHCKSNAIVLASNGSTVGIGVGQTNRIWATNQAIEHSEGKCKGSVLASDAFFPFADCVEEAHKAGITAIVQPGGSIRDIDSIEACDKYGIAMIFVGQRHFKH
jgi:phosphoribosylaminoimidazolecarboxamide formyltransferase/IMP cyclohydrolase